MQTCSVENLHCGQMSCVYQRLLLQFLKVWPQLYTVLKSEVSFSHVWFCSYTEFPWHADDAECVCVLAAAKRIDSCDATVMTTTNHYVDFPICTLHAAYLPHPPPLLSSLSILLLEAQTAAEQGSEKKNTMIVSDEQEGLRERDTPKESGSLRVTEQGVGERRKSEHCKGHCLVIQEHRRLWRVTAPPPDFVYICV